MCGLFVFFFVSVFFFFSFPVWFHIGHTVDDSISKNQHSIPISLNSSAHRLAQDSIILPGGPCDLGSSPGSSLLPCVDQDPSDRYPGSRSLRPLPGTNRLQRRRVDLLL